MPRLGVHPLIWSNDDVPELGDDTPLEVCLHEASAAGYTGIELGRKMPRDAAKLRAVLAPHGLALVSGWVGLRLLERSPAEELARIAPQLALLAALGCEVAVVAEVSASVYRQATTALDRRPVLDASAFRRFADDLEALTLGAREQHDLALAYHPHLGTVIETVPDVEALLAATSDAVGLTLDTGHLRAAGGAPEAVAERWAPRIRHVHAKDVRPEVVTAMRRRGASFLAGVRDGIFTAPGQGLLDFAAVLRPLARAGYRGWLVVEVDHDPRRVPACEVAAAGYEAIASAAKAVGLS